MGIFSKAAIPIVPDDIIVNLKTGTNQVNHGMGVAPHTVTFFNEDGQSLPTTSWQNDPDNPKGSILVDVGSDIDRVKIKCVGYMKLMIALLVGLGIFNNSTAQTCNPVIVCQEHFAPVKSHDTIATSGTKGMLGVGTLTPAPTAIGEFSSTTKGLLTPRMTQAQRNAISSPATGLLIYNTNSNQFNYWDGTQWVVSGGGGGCQTDTSISVTLSQSQILALNGTPITVIPAPAAGFKIMLLAADAKRTAGTAYATNTELQLTFKAGTATPLAINQSTLTDVGDSTRIFNLQTDGLVSIAQPLLVYVPTGNPTTGTNGIKITLKYSIVNATTGAVTCFGAQNVAAPTLWNITGNSGTNPSTNFIGTTDSVDFVIKTDNTQRALYYANGDYEYETDVTHTASQRGFLGIYNNLFEATITSASTDQTNQIINDGTNLYLSSTRQSNGDNIRISLDTMGAQVYGTSFGYYFPRTTGNSGDVITADGAGQSSWQPPMAPSRVSQWVKVTKTYTDFAAASTTNDISIYTLPQKGIVQAVTIYPSTTFSGGGISAYTLDIGEAGDLAKYALNNTVFTGAPTIYSASTGVQVNSIGGTVDIRAKATSVTANLNAATQGSVDIWLLISTLP